MPNDDRSAILRRRAFFVSSAMAALGACTRTPPAEPEAPTPRVVSVPSVPQDAAVSSEDAPAPESTADAAPDSDVAPPLIMPAAVSDTARAKYEQLISTMTRAYRVLDEIEADMPSCGISSAKCAPSYRRIATKLHELDGMFQRMFVCGGSSPEAKSYEDLARAHQRHYEKRRSNIQQRIDALLAADGESGKTLWQDFRRDAFQAAPHPCLKFGCPDW